MDDHDKVREGIRTLRRISTTGVMDADAFSDAVFFVTRAAESTLPKTKTVEVWRVECAAKDNAEPRTMTFFGEATAKDWAREEVAGQHFTCIKVTGPHQQEVPA